RLRKISSANPPNPPNPAVAAPNPAQGRASRWAHVPLTTLFEEQGNRLFPRPGGLYESGHEPMHGSKSGRCVFIEPAAGRWWCRSCRQGGDAASFVMTLNGWNYARAARWLTERYGSPGLSAQPRQLTFLEV